MSFCKVIYALGMLPSKVWERLVASPFRCGLAGRPEVQLEERLGLLDR